VHPKNKVGDTLRPSAATIADQQMCKPPSTMPITTPVLNTLMGALLISVILQDCGYAPIAYS